MFDLSGIVSTVVRFDLPGCLEPHRSRVLDARAVVSRRTVVPPPTDTDDDWLIFTDADGEKEILDALGETRDFTGEAEPASSVGSPFASLRCGEVNLIVTTEEPFFRAFVVATEVCRRLNLKGKEDRILVFRAILYKEYPV
jgi:hypothetical protein